MQFRRIFSLARENPQYTTFMEHQAHKTAMHVEPLKWSPLDGISGFLIGAAIKGEDSHFLVHRGINMCNTIKRTYYALRNRQPVRGISSITQQTARNLFLTPDRALQRKFLEAIYAVLMEQIFSKQRIIEIYLNVVEFGKGLWGCTAAASYYFQKQPGGLDLFEAIFLVSLLPAPRAELKGRNLQRIWTAQMHILHVMYLSELVTLEQFATALSRAKGVYQLLVSDVEPRTALAYMPAQATPPAFPLVMRDNQCSCTLQSILETKCGLFKELERWRILKSRFDQATLQRAMVTNDYSALSKCGPFIQSNSGEAVDQMEERCR
jgi:membrane peptidoglycan carboxypeptidase